MRQELTIKELVSKETVVLCLWGVETNFWLSKFISSSSEKHFVFVSLVMLKKT